MTIFDLEAVKKIAATHAAHEKVFLARRLDNACAEIEQLRAVALYLVQQDNGGPCLNRGGKPCRELDKCGCYLELAEIINQQYGSKE